MIAIGFGMGGDCPIDGVVLHLRSCRDWARQTAGTDHVIGVFSVDRTAHRIVLSTVEAALDAPGVLLRPDQLLAARDSVITQSQLSLDHYGVGSVAEAAALVGAGPGSRLLGPRWVRDNATFAAAIASEGTP